MLLPIRALPTRPQRFSYAAAPVALAAAALALCSGLSPAAAAPLPPHSATANSAPDSFVPRLAPTMSALLGQVQADPRVRRRYARYFHMPEAQVLPYLRANLVVSRLSDPALYTMFCVHPSGLVYPTEIPLPRGSRVFALRGGPAVLTLPEGNPLVRFQKAVETHLLPRPAAVPEPPAPVRQTAAPLPPREIIVPTSVPTPVYPAVSPLTPAERDDAPPAPPAAKPQP